MTNVAWRNDDFEERGIDPWMFASGTANNSIIEKQSVWNQGVSDLICIGPGGRIVIVEAKFDPSRTDRNPVRWPNPGWANRNTLVINKWHVDTCLYSIVLSRSLIDEPPPQVESNSSVSSCDDYEQQQEAAAIHPLTKSVYDQLRNIPEAYRDVMTDLLGQFASFLPKNESSKFSPFD